ncbi:MAG TPA: AraC family transcriptional regulator [Niabella sp.]|nr:AraC family transcriptional regulator [Niabella sp.]
MRPTLEDVALRKGNYSFVVHPYSTPAFEFKWHYHPEYELTLIVQGSGSRIVGDSHLPFQENDLVLLGPWLPHTWFSHSGYNGECKAVVIQFSESFLKPFYSFTEFEAIAELLKDAGRGLCFEQDANIIKEITSISETKEMHRVARLFNILQLLLTKKRNHLSQKFFALKQSEKSQTRINEVCKFVHDHAGDSITLEEVARKIHLSKSAFCKFFKRTMKVTFSEYINDIRIANACRLLIFSDHTIREIAVETGFDNITYFNRVFFKKKNCTPSAFRKAVAENYAGHVE